MTGPKVARLKTDDSIVVYDPDWQPLLPAKERVYSPELGTWRVFLAGRLAGLLLPPAGPEPPVNALAAYTTFAKAERARENEEASLREIVGRTPRPFHLSAPKRPTIALFIDASYVYKEFVQRHGRLDYPRLRTRLARQLGGEIVDSQFFNAVSSPAVAQLHAALRSQDFTVHEGWLQSRPLRWPDGTEVIHPVTNEAYQLTVQKSVDVTLAYHLIRSHVEKNWSSLLLVAGDADFETPVAALVDEEGVELHLVGIEGTISRRLQRYAAEIHLLDKSPLREDVAFASSYIHNPSGLPF